LFQNFLITILSSIEQISITKTQSNILDIEISFPLIQFSISKRSHRFIETIEKKAVSVADRALSSACDHSKVTDVTWMSDNNRNRWKKYKNK
jgi:hypothetical protein